MKKIIFLISIFLISLSVNQLVDDCYGVRFVWSGEEDIQRIDMGQKDYVIYGDSSVFRMGDGVGGEGGMLERVVYGDEDLMVKIEPESVDFDERMIGEKTTMVIEISNLSEDEELAVFGVSTDSIEFYAGPVVETKINPSGSLTIELSFVPVREGKREVLFSIFTNFGVILYKAQGKGVNTPYKLTPILSQDIPIGTNYATSLSMYNPTDGIVQIEEVYMYNNFLNFHLPVGDHIWTIQPHTENVIMNIDFNSSECGKFNGKINIKTNNRFWFVVAVDISVKNERDIEGSLSFFPIQLELEGTYPGLVLSKTVFASSSYETAVQIESMTAEKKNLIIEPLRKIVPPGEQVPIAQVRYLPDEGFRNELQKILLSFSVTDGIEEIVFKKGRYNRLWNKSFQKKDETELTFVSNISTYTVPVSTLISRPTVLKDTEILDFGLTYISKTNDLYLPVYNPDCNPVFITVLISSNESSFYVNPVSSPLLIPPRSYVNIGPVLYSPTSPVPETADMLIMNNISILDTVKLIGHGGSPDIKIFGELSKTGKAETEKQISIMNIGNMPLISNGIFIDDKLCAGYGYEISNCIDSFTLNPGESKNFTLRIDASNISDNANRRLLISSPHKEFVFPLNYNLASLREYSLRAIIIDVALLIIFIVILFYVMKMAKRFARSKNIMEKDIKLVKVPKSNPKKKQKEKKTKQDKTQGNDIAKVDEVKKGKTAPVQLQKETISEVVGTQSPTPTLVKKKTTADDKTKSAPALSTIEKETKKTNTNMSKSTENLVPIIEKNDRAVSPVKKIQKIKLEKLKMKKEARKLNTGLGLKLGKVNQTEEYQKFIDIRAKLGIDIDKSKSLPSLSSLPVVNPTPKQEKKSKGMSSTTTNLPVIQIKADKSSDDSQITSPSKRKKRKPKYIRKIKEEEIEHIEFPTLSILDLEIPEEKELDPTDNLFTDKSRKNSIFYFDFDETSESESVDNSEPIEPVENISDKVESPIEPARNIIFNYESVKKAEPNSGESIALRTLTTCDNASLCCL
eukprot:TRINITY_DN3975_c0_g1_i1.p1 TRINITY_DN3975_c0_g1~~TRINITY_DN3975_c0_g1_i1.p1  ORF type:complete len:1026 (+),score=256.16 TRINITY_DN3975_c0_g1_i1:36-3113(+)